MATETRRSRILIEDWTGVTTTNVIPPNQERWYDTVTGYQTSEIIRLVGDGSTTIASLLKRQELTGGAQTLYGVKTFDDIPVLPASDPTSANQATNKTYVDTQITGSLGLPSGYIYGLETVADTDATNDVLIAVGKCRDYDDTVDLELTTAMTKQIDVTWAAGDDEGGLFSGSVAADTTYHLFLIKKDSDGSIDAGWDTDIDAANIPTGYTEYRRIRSYLTETGPGIIDTIQTGDKFTYKAPIEDMSSDPGTTRADLLLSIPIDRSFRSTLTAVMEHGSASAVIILPKYSDDIAPLYSGPCSVNSNAGCGSNDLTIDTDSSGYVTARRGNGVPTTAKVYTTGWYDDRGQYGGK